jgi:prepilin-type N-terminal cleavage/methylation domain-containing protein
MKHARYGFTIVEIIIVITVLGILTALSAVSFNGWQRDAADSATKSDLIQATSSLESYQNFKDDYPPNLAGTNFAASNTVVLTLYTNAPQTRTYENLTPAQNTQLFLNSCNANMPITSSDGSTTYNTSCVLSGKNLHVKGQVSSNIVIDGPTVQQSDIVLNCGSRCDAALSAMIDEFLAQNGSFPLTIPNQQVALPDPVLTSYGSATDYCLEARASAFNDIVYHTLTGGNSVVVGSCPNDPELHYP